jgi:hypothetical protein
MMLKCKRREASLVTVAAENAGLSERTSGCRRMQGRAFLESVAKRRILITYQEPSSLAGAVRATTNNEDIMLTETNPTPNGGSGLSKSPPITTV